MIIIIIIKLVDRPVVLRLWRAPWLIISYCSDVHGFFTTHPRVVVRCCRIPRPCAVRIAIFDWSSLWTAIFSCTRPADWARRTRYPKIWCRPTATFCPAFGLPSDRRNRPVTQRSISISFRCFLNYSNYYFLEFLRRPIFTLRPLSRSPRPVDRTTAYSIGVRWRNLNKNIDCRYKIDFIRIFSLFTIQYATSILLLGTRTGWQTKCHFKPLKRDCVKYGLPPLRKAFSLT